MDDRISIGDLALAVQEAAIKYPEARVVSIGTGRKATSGTICYTS